MFREQDADGKVKAKPQRSTLETSQLGRFQLDLRGSLASRLLDGNSPAGERADVQVVINAWTKNWARMSGQSATQVMPV